MGVGGRLAVAGRTLAPRPFVRVIVLAFAAGCPGAGASRSPDSFGEGGGHAL